MIIFWNQDTNSGLVKSTKCTMLVLYTAFYFYHTSFVGVASCHAAPRQAEQNNTPSYEHSCGLLGSTPTPAEPRFFNLRYGVYYLENGGRWTLVSTEDNMESHNYGSCIKLEIFGIRWLQRGKVIFWNLWVEYHGTILRNSEFGYYYLLILQLQFHNSTISE